MPKVAVGAALLTCSLVAAASVGVQARGKPVAGCPSGGGWTLITVVALAQELGVPFEQFNGIPSLDGNADGYTCVDRHTLGNGAEAIIFRDNNVRD